MSVTGEDARRAFRQERAPCLAGGGLFELSFFVGVSLCGDGLVVSSGFSMLILAPFAAVSCGGRAVGSASSPVLEGLRCGS